MSYSEETKKQAYDLYVELLKGGTKEHNILAKICKEMDITRETLRIWRQDYDWSHRAKTEILFSGRADFLQILLAQQAIATQHITAENIAAILEANSKLTNFIYQNFGQANETNDNNGTAGESEDVDGGEVFGDDATVSPIFGELKEKPIDD